MIFSTIGNGSRTTLSIAFYLKVGENVNHGTQSVKRCFHLAAARLFPVHSMEDSSMRIIAFGDIHMATHMLAGIPEVESADLMIATGDLTNYGKQKEAKKVLDDLLGYNRNLLALIGNLDNFEINDYLEELGLNLHRQARLLDRRICLLGAGGSNHTPFDTPAEFSESELTEVLTDAHDQGQDFISLTVPDARGGIPVILISHVPPYNTRVDMLRNGKHVGSSAVRSYIEKHQPDVCITGHIHEARGEDYIGKTHIVNPGALIQGGWVEITYNQSTLQAILH